MTSWSPARQDFWEASARQLVSRGENVATCANPIPACHCRFTAGICHRRFARRSFSGRAMNGVQRVFTCRCRLPFVGQNPQDILRFNVAHGQSSCRRKKAVSSVLSTPAPSPPSRGSPSASPTKFTNSNAKNDRHYKRSSGWQTGSFASGKKRIACVSPCHTPVALGTGSPRLPENYRRFS